MRRTPKSRSCVGCVGAGGSIAATAVEDACSAGASRRERRAGFFFFIRPPRGRDSPIDFAIGAWIAAGAGGGGGAAPPKPPGIGASSSAETA